MTEADRRAAEIRSRRPPRDPDWVRPPLPPTPSDEWIDEGSVRDEAIAATSRATAGAAPRRRRDGSAPDPELAGEVAEVVGDRRAERLLERLAAANHALERERFDEAKRIVTPLLRELPGVAAVHEIAGLSQYRLGMWKPAARELEAARALRESVELLPVLADCYRALRRWPDVDRTWDAVKRSSPSHDVMAEARIVTAGSLADRGDIKAAIALLAPAAQSPKRVRDHHLRQWYALADLYDRAGDTMSATKWFRAVATHDPDFVDVTARLRSLGR